MKYLDIDLAVALKDGSMVGLTIHAVATTPEEEKLARDLVGALAMGRPFDLSGFFAGAVVQHVRGPFEVQEAGEA